MNTLPEDTTSFLKQIVELADSNNFKIYLIGGLVRDKLLGIDTNSLDVDLLINFDIEKFKSFFDSKFSSDLNIRKNFLTASFKTQSDCNIDFVQTRKEIYETPGALPLVSASDFNEDLKRRDFTVNTLRVLLSDFLNHSDDLKKYVVKNEKGLKDLKERKIRVLHEKSFLDDPTRIFRAIKYKIKINGSYEEQTEKYLNLSVKENYLKHISNYRSLQEFLKILSEKDYKKILVDIIELNLKLPYFSNVELSKIVKMDDFNFSESRIKTLKYLTSLIDEDMKISFFNDLNISKKERKEFLN